MVWFRICGITFLFLFLTSHSIHAYERDVHYDLTKYLARWAGFSESEAEQVATADQEIDAKPEFNPLPNPNFCPELRKIAGLASAIVAIPAVCKNDPEFERMVAAQRAYHFVDSERLQALRESAFCGRNLKTLGHYLHALQDSFAHSLMDYADLPPLDKLVASLGHLPDEKILGHFWYGHSLDKTYERPDLAEHMARYVYAELARFKDSANRWNDIDAAIARFVREQDSQKKLAHLSASTAPKLEEMPKLKSATAVPRGIIYYTQDGSLWLGDVDGPQQRLLVRGNVVDFSVSRDGRVLYVQRRPDGKYEIHMLRSRGNAELVEALDDHLDSSISPDGSHAVISREKKGSYLVNLATRKRKGVPSTPFPKALRERYGPVDEAHWGWFNDDIFTWSPDGKTLAFRRCSGDPDKPSCLPYLYRVGDNQSPELVAERIAIEDEHIPNFYPIGFEGRSLLFSAAPDIYAYDTSTRRVTLIAQDAWLAGFSLNRRFIVFLSSYRSGGANVWLMDLDGREKKRLTDFPRMSPVSLAWSAVGNKIFFELMSDKTHDVETWEVNPDGSCLRKLADGQAIPPQAWGVTVTPE